MSTLVRIKPAKMPTPEIPTVSEVEALRLDKAVAEFEAIQARMQVLELQAGQQQAVIQGLLQQATRDGYVLQRDPRGVWAYQAKPGNPVKGSE